jgi:hypothetical protein
MRFLPETGDDDTTSKLDETPPPNRWIGRSVCSFDGKRIGRVRAFTNTHIMVRHTWRSSSWIPRILVRGASRESLVLHVQRSLLDRYMYDNPRGTGAQ